LGTAIEVFDTDAGRSRTIREDGCEAAADDERRLSELRLYRPRQSAACRPAELLRRDLQPGPVLGVKVALKGEIPPVSKKCILCGTNLDKGKHYLSASGGSIIRACAYLLPMWVLKFLRNRKCSNSVTTNK
jgi:hypothetical protein